LLAQYLGAFLGSAIVFSNYFNAINAYDFGMRSVFGTNKSTGQIFTTFPDRSENIGGALLDQVKNNSTKDVLNSRQRYYSNIFFI
jgi:glycerol uptake facilitator-like aquaporin